MDTEEKKVPVCHAGSLMDGRKGETSVVEKKQQEVAKEAESQVNRREKERDKSRLRKSHHEGAKEVESQVN